MPSGGDYWSFSKCRGLSERVLIAMISSPMSMVFPRQYWDIFDGIR